MWNQRRNTIATEEVGSRGQNMLKVSSDRSFIRQKSHSKSGNRLSIFANTTESLMTLLRHPDKRQSFRAFLKSEYSEENFDFWLECEDYRHTKPKQRKKAAIRIYDTYLGPDATHEINIDAETRAKTESQLQDPREDTFDAAQKHIFDLMERDSFRRFVLSAKPW